MSQVSAKIAIHFEPAASHWAEAGNEVMWRSAIRQIVEDAGFTSAEISLAIVDDSTIRQLNRQYLQHDYATDVITFPLGHAGGHLEGEVVASAETAARQAQTYEWEPCDELLLYVIHGSLHLVGYDDSTPAASAEMRAAERRYVQQLGRRPPISQPAEREWN